MFSLKPENILIDADGYTKLCDFGLSLLPPTDSTNSIADDASSSSSVSSSSVTTMKEGSKIATTTFFGTLEYLPPEFFTKRLYSGQSDLWAFGCLLYELLVGLPPFMDAKGNSVNTCRRILRKSWTKLANSCFLIDRDWTRPASNQDTREQDIRVLSVWLAQTATDQGSFSETSVHSWSQTTPMVRRN